MRNFTYENQTKIIFGKDTVNKLSEEIIKYGKNILFHYGGGSIKRSGLYDKVISELKNANVNYIELGGVMPNPRLSLVNEGIKLVRENNIDFILAVGGGSVIDSAKAIGIGSLYEGDVWDFFGGTTKPQNTIPVGVILTIPAAGSESSTGTVITNEDGWYKKSTGAPFMRPKFAIMDPTLTFTLSSYQTACGIADMIAHVFERYFTHQTDVSFTDELCEATMRTIIKHSKYVIDDPLNYSHRAEIMWAGAVAHNGFLGVGRIEDWASHVIEHELSAIYDIAHGAGLAIIFPAWMKYVYKENKSRFIQFGKNVFGINCDCNDDEFILTTITKVEDFFKDLGLPIRLNEINIDNSNFELMASKITERGTVGSFKRLDKQDIINIYNLALE